MRAESWISFWKTRQFYLFSLYLGLLKDKQEFLRSLQHIAYTNKRCLRINIYQMENKEDLVEELMLSAQMVQRMCPRHGFPAVHSPVVVGWFEFHTTQQSFEKERPRVDLNAAFLLLCLLCFSASASRKLTLIHQKSAGRQSQLCFRICLIDCLFKQKVHRFF